MQATTGISGGNTYEEALRVPFIVRYPGAVKDPGRKADQMMLNIDLAPSLLDMVGLPVPGKMDGESILPVLQSGSAPGRKAWLYEYFKEFPYNVPELNAVRTETHIYVEYEGGRSPELFDIVNDPREKKNLMGTPEGQRLLPELKEMLEGLKQGKRY